VKQWFLEVNLLVFDFKNYSWKIDFGKKGNLEKEPTLVIDGHSSRENPEPIKLLNDASASPIILPSTYYLIEVFPNFKD
jgi:hypothetical protein